MCTRAIYHQGTYVYLQHMCVYIYIIICVLHRVIVWVCVCVGCVRRPGASGSYIGLASEATQLVMESAGGLPGSFKPVYTGHVDLRKVDGLGSTFFPRANLIHFAVASPFGFGWQPWGHLWRQLGKSWTI